MAIERAQETLAEFVYSMNDVTGALLASLDGRPIVSDLAQHQGENQVAAIVASSFGLGQRMVELLGPSRVDEIVVRSESGLVIVYAAGNEGALVVLTRPSVNLGLLHLRARDVASLLKGATDSRRSFAP